MSLHFMRVRSNVLSLKSHLKCFLKKYSSELLSIRWVSGRVFGTNRYENWFSLVFLGFLLS